MYTVLNVSADGLKVRLNAPVVEPDYMELAKSSVDSPPKYKKRAISKSLSTAAAALAPAQRRPQTPCPELACRCALDGARFELCCNGSWSRPPRVTEHLYEDVDDAWVMLECRSAAANPDMQLLLNNMGARTPTAPAHEFRRPPRNLCQP